MPAKPAYLHRLADAIAALESSTHQWVDRKSLEELLGVSTTVAWRILRRSGAEEGPGGALVLPRPAMIEALRRLAETGGFAQEIRRRNRLDEYLASMARYASARHRKIVPAGRALELVSSRFGKLPQGVELTSRRLTIEFSSVEDFLEKLASIVFAVHNDYEAISEFIETAIFTTRAPLS